MIPPAALDNYRKSVKAQPDLAQGAAETYYYFKEDFKQAEEFWDIAAEQDLYSAAEFANILMTDKYKNVAKARYLLEKVANYGAEQGLQNNIMGTAYFQLATLLENADSGDKDLGRALALYQMSIDLAAGFSNDYETQAKARVQALQNLSR